MLWVDAHRPTSLDRLDFHAPISDRLKRLAASEELPHLLIYGPSGAGKKTRVMALLKELYGPNALKTRLEHKTFKHPTQSKKVEITTVASNYHIEMNPSDVGNDDRLVVQEVIKEIAMYRLADTNAQKQFKVVVLVEVDQLSKAAQHALRRTMEKYTGSCRLILCCNSPSKVIDPLRSRCLGIRIGAPTHDEIVSVLQKVCVKENLTFCAPLAMEIAKKSERNLRRALLMLETCRVQTYPFMPDQPIPLPEWEEYIAGLAKDVLQEQSPGSLLKARDKLYELLSNCIPSDIILKVLLRELTCRLDDDLKHELAHYAAYYEHRLQCGQKAIFHLEAFLAKFMTIYKKFLLDFYM
ncbi:replication factor C subunit 3/5 [Saprolegnia diclina VS20]|uniref:Replication factor C subunit 3/5 n=1 Tax=Saprolegnia diclina (strain VS20) TaxID=1156394 RepID=T0PMX2_SAPDV|nr:replication factor C subunit 3/5 [Saprolegnia diclina VS20]EQC26764.1 replication factor C subunit 3/5 [Saprolegnia diclina VS20]|eukprot:XP_008619807.1 replication factor C subunit 3/5 [Saprolegnia diclina VS20]